MEIKRALKSEERRGKRRAWSERRRRGEEDEHRSIAECIRDLARVRFHETSTLLLVLLLVSLWMFRAPNFLTGWATYFCPESLTSANSTLSELEKLHCIEMKPKDSTAAMAVLLLMFMIPSKPFAGSASPTLVTWPLVQKRLAWGLLFMRGGGFSIADAFEVRSVPPSLPPCLPCFQHLL